MTRPAGQGRRAAAIASEQAHLDRVARRVEVLRRQAQERLDAAQGARLGSTFSAQFERDVISHHQAGRVARFTLGDREALLFGRLDLSDGESLAIGRLSVIDEDGVLLVDWRAPAAAPFYRATAARSEGVARRRTILVEGPEVVDVADELLDATSAEALGLEVTSGQGALLASLERTHDHGMRDIVATIQRDQDRIIRAPAAGTLIVTGGPGTGKTVVALHRVAFLLYSDRERFENRGVLVVGPSRTFTDYTRRVLPSLGEDRTVQRPLEALGPVGVTVVGWDGPDVAEVKGRSGMVEVCRRMLIEALPPIPPSTRFTVAGTTVVIDGQRIAAVRRRLIARVDPTRPSARYHARAQAAQDALMAELRGAWERRRASAPSAAGDPSPEAFAEIVVEAPEIRMLLRCFWPPVVAADVLASFASGARPLARVAHDIATPSELSAVEAAWRASPGWTVEDMALLDEIDALLGPDGPPPVGREDDGPQPPDVTDRWYADFAHIVVDEAQDLSPMQWRAVVRRGPYASWTVVGDLAQRARRAEPSTWEQVAALIGRRQVTVERLGTNYRTPSELASVARRALALAGHDPTSFPETVRSNGRHPLVVIDTDPCGTGLRRALGSLGDDEGTIGIVAVPGDRDAILASLASLPGSTDSPARGMDAVRVLDPRQVKGLEFDDLVVVAPERILAASALGAHDLYVSLTRATRSLRVVTGEPGSPVLDGIATLADL